MFLTFGFSQKYYDALCGKCHLRCFHFCIRRVFICFDWDCCACGEEREGEKDKEKLQGGSELDTSKKELEIPGNQTPDMYTRHMGSLDAPTALSLHISSNSAGSGSAGEKEEEKEGGNESATPLPPSEDEMVKE